MHHLQRELDVFKYFTPLNGLKRQYLSLLASRTELRKSSVGDMIFDHSNKDMNAIYLLRGIIELTHSSNKVVVIRSGTDESRHPLNSIFPNLSKGIVLSEHADFLIIDNNFLNAVLVWNKTGIYQVNELVEDKSTSDSTDDWMTTLVRSKVFQKISALNMQKVFMRLERIHCQSGDQIIKLGDEVRHYYVIESGVCQVTRKDAFSEGGISISRLTNGADFGELELISASRSGIDVSMITQGSIMRLNKQDFRSLILNSIIRPIGISRADKLILEGAMWIDIRATAEYAKKVIRSGLNIPLHLLGIQSATLDKSTSYIIYCDDDLRGAAAAYLLTKNGFDVYLLNDDIAAIKPIK